MLCRSLHVNDDKLLDEKEERGRRRKRKRKIKKDKERRSDVIQSRDVVSSV